MDTRQAIRTMREKEVDNYDDTDLIITEKLYFDLKVFEQRCDNDGIAYQHFTDWYDNYDLPALEENGLIRRAIYLKQRDDGWRKYYPETPYELTIKARKILHMPGKYIQRAGSG